MKNGTFTTATAKGHRSYQEDRFFTFVSEAGTLLGVFDGHGGDECSEYLSSKGYLHIVEEVNAVHNEFGKAGGTEDAFRRAFRRIASETDHMRAGSSATVAFIDAQNSEAVCAVVGDSPVLARWPDGSLFIGPDHNVRTNQAEGKAAEERGGILYNGYVWNGSPYGDYARGLQMARAFGDSELGKIISREPEIFKIEIGLWLLLGTDGIASPGHTEVELKVGYENIAKLLDDGGDAQKIVDRALRAQTGDNVTAIVWRKA
jgi:serine/threonine protein phosphatase PrpC